MTHADWTAHNQPTVADKMRGGMPLTDEDREPWLLALGRAAGDTLARCACCGCGCGGRARGTGGLAGWLGGARQMAVVVVVSWPFRQPVSGVGVQLSGTSPAAQTYAPACSGAALDVRTVHTEAHLHLRDAPLGLAARLSQPCPHCLNNRDRKSVV